MFRELGKQGRITRSGSHSNASMQKRLRARGGLLSRCVRPLIRFGRIKSAVPSAAAAILVDRASRQLTSPLATLASIVARIFGARAAASLCMRVVPVLGVLLH